MRAADQLIDSIVNSSRIPSRRQRQEIQRELRDHIEDFIAAARAAGRPPEEIETLVLASFGDPGRIAGSFAWVYRHERRRFRVFAYALSTVALAVSLFAAILATQTGLALGFGTPVMKVIASRHTIIEALDILASVAAYLGLISLETLFKRRPFAKAAAVLAGIVSILMLACTAAGLPVAFLVYGLVNAIFFRAIQRLIAPELARFAIVAVCFPLAGLVLNSLRSPAHADPAATCASWLVMGAGYLAMTYAAARLDGALRVHA